MEDIFNKQFSESRRNFLRKSSLGFGSIALSSMLSPSLGMAKNFPVKHFFNKWFASLYPKGKRVIYLFQSGGPLKLKPMIINLCSKNGTVMKFLNLKKTQRNSGMVEGQSSYPLVKSIFNFKQYGQSGAWVSELSFILQKLWMSSVL